MKLQYKIMDTTKFCYLTHTGVLLQDDGEFAGDVVSDTGIGDRLHLLHLSVACDYDAEAEPRTEGCSTSRARSQVADYPNSDLSLTHGKACFLIVLYNYELILCFWRPFRAP